jgi:glutaredoxin-related protein
MPALSFEQRGLVISSESGLPHDRINERSPMPRHILNESQIHPAIQAVIANHQREVVEDVQAAIADHRVVVVGMRQNPVCKAVQKRLTAANIHYHLMEYGSYFSQWRKRNALKLWTGWPTFPMVFVDGVLVGGDSDVKNLIEAGQLSSERL